MMRFYLTLIANLVLGVCLTFLTLEVLRAADLFQATKLDNLLGYILAGPITGLSLVLAVVIIFAIDCFWALYFGLWLIKKWLHIKDKDNTIYLP